VAFVATVQMKIRKISHRRLGSLKFAELGHGHFTLLLCTAKKCTKICNTSAQPLSTSPHLLFSDILVAVVVSLSSLTENSEEAAATQTYLVNIFVGFYWSRAREQCMLAM